jgi:ADP-heptose:LPS heptosyltransferase
LLVFVSRWSEVLTDEHLCYIFDLGMSMKSAPPEYVMHEREKAFALFPGALGDFICFMPALQVLARRCDVHLFARTEFADLTPSAVQVRSLECYEIRRLFAPGAAAEDRVRRFFAGYACIYSWMGSRQEQFVREFSQAAGDGRIFPFRLQAWGSHQAEYYLSCIGQNGCDLPLPEIAPKSEAVGWSAEFWARHELENRPVLTVGPGSGGREKIWPTEHFCAVIDWWRGTVGGEAVVVLGPVEEDRGGWEPLGKRALVVRNLTLAQVAALLGRSGAYLGNDSGITHLAAAVGVQTLALFGPSDPQRWRPRGKRVTLLHAAAECAAGENSPADPCIYRKSLHELTSGEVIAHMEKLREVASLTRWGSGIRVFP